MTKKIVALAFFDKMTARNYQKIKKRFYDIGLVWSAGKNELLSAGLSEKFVSDFLTWRKDNPPEKNLEILEQKNISTLSITEPQYPKLLKQIFDPPMVLFYRGQLKTQGLRLGVVGTRKMSRYAEEVINKIIPPLARAKLTIVSGLALGADGAAHRATIAAQGNTWAILGGSVEKNMIYPAVHNRLAEEIVDSGGAVISEYPPGFLPTSYSFPMRNRIIAGVSQGVLIVEAPKKSGALITASSALDNNREVFCVPHQIFSLNAVGGHQLIKAGAKLVDTPEDILEEFNISRPEQAAKLVELKDDEEKIYKLLQAEPRHINEIIKLSALQSTQVNAILSNLELKDLIKNMGNMIYSS